MLNLNDTIRQLREWKRIKEEAETMEKTYTDKVKAEMTAQNVEALSGIDWKVTWTNGTQTKFDTKKFKAEHPDLYAVYAYKVPSRRFLLS